MKTSFRPGLLAVLDPIHYYFHYFQLWRKNEAFLWMFKEKRQRDSGENPLASEYKTFFPFNSNLLEN